LVHSYDEPETSIPYAFFNDPILHRLAMKPIGMTLKDLIEWLKQFDIHVTPEEVIKIVKDEWKKGEQMDSWLKVVPRSYLKEVLEVDPEDC